MAEINQAAAGSSPGVRRSKKLSTRVDLTPMVDLGFLLITFFIFTTQMQKARALKMLMPANGAPMNVGESSSLTVIPLEGDSLFYYHGSPEAAEQTQSLGFTTYSVSDGLGQVIRQKQAAMDASGLNRNDLMLLIKPAGRSSYLHFVDILDEVKINDVQHYATMDISEYDRKLLGNRQ